MDKRTKVLTNQNGEVVFVGTHAECSRWLIEKYPNHHDTRINSNVPNPVLPGIFIIQYWKEMEDNGERNHKCVKSDKQESIFYS